MQLRELIDVLEAIAPTRFAEPWDNVGLLVGDPAPAGHAGAADDRLHAGGRRRGGGDAVRRGRRVPPADLQAASSASPPTGRRPLVFDAVRRGVALYSPHTALDVAEGGTNDVLADVARAAPTARRCELRRGDARAVQARHVRARATLSSG